MIKHISWRRGRFIIDGEETALVGAHTWFLVQRPQSEREIAIEFLDKLVEDNHNWTVLWCWAGPGVNPSFGSRSHLDRLSWLIDECLVRDIVPVVMLFSWYQADNVKFDPRKMDWKKHMQAVVDMVAGRPVIYEIMRECPKEMAEWQVAAVGHLKSIDAHKRIIHVNTGGGTGGMSADQLWDADAPSIAYIDSPKELEVWAEFLPKKMIVYDTDHDRVNESPARQKPKIQNAFDLGMPILYMDGFPGSEIPFWDGRVEKHQPAMWKWLGELRGVAPDPPPPPPPPVEEPPGEKPPADPPPPPQNGNNTIEKIVDNIEEWLKESGLLDVLEEWLEERIRAVVEEILREHARRKLMSIIDAWDGI